MQGNSNPNRGLSFSHYSWADPKNSQIFQNNNNNIADYIKALVTLDIFAHNIATL